jgi:hypothetical protein
VKSNKNNDKKGAKSGVQRGGCNNKKTKGKSRGDSWMVDSSEEEEDFIIEETETEDEGEWDGEESSEEELDNSDREGESSGDDFQKKYKSRNKKNKATGHSDGKRDRNATTRKNAKTSIINVDDDSEDKGVDTSADDIFVDDEKDLIVRNNEKKGKETKKSPYFSSVFEEKKDDDDDDNESKSEKSSGMVDNHGSNSNVKNKRRRMILSDGDDESSDDGYVVRQQLRPMKMGRRPNASSLSDDDTAEEDVLADTPAKLTKEQQHQSFSSDDFVDDEEAKAIEKAMKYSLKDERKRKRLKKVGDSLASLDRLRQEQKQKKKIIYMDDLEDESIIDIDNDENQDEDEDDIYEVVNEEEQTASEVLKEANALSAKIVEVVSRWCGGEVGKVQGLILGDGALNLGGGTKNRGDKMWISKEAMKHVMPNVELAEYQLLGVNWIALLNRTTFGSRSSSSSKKTADVRDGGMTVNGILADEVSHFIRFCVLYFCSLC